MPSHFVEGSRFVQARIEGLEDVDKAVAELARVFGPKNARGVYTRLVGRILRPHRIDLWTKTPFDKGRLRESVNVRVGKGRHGTTVAGRLGWQGLSGRHRARKPQALAIEFGNKRRRKKGRVSPILRPLFDRLHPSWERQFSRGIRDEVQRTARRLRRRYWKGRLRRR